MVTYLAKERTENKVFPVFRKKRMGKGKRIMHVTERIFFFRYTLYTKSLQEEI